MPVVNRSALVMHTCEQMYNLINDVDAYPLFVPDCVDSKLLSQTDDTMTAALKVSRGGVNKWFTTKNTLIKNTQVKLELVDGPFNSLIGCWNLHPLSEEACKVTLDLKYEFSNRMFDLAFGRAFNQIANGMVQAFTQRAKQVYK